METILAKVEVKNGYPMEAEITFKTNPHSYKHYTQKIDVKTFVISLLPVDEDGDVYDDLPGKHLHVRKQSQNRDKTLRGFTRIEKAINDGKITYDEGFMLGIYVQSVELDDLRRQLEKSKLPECNVAARRVFYPLNYINDPDAASRLLTICKKMDGLHVDTQGH